MKQIVFLLFFLFPLSLFAQETSVIQVTQQSPQFKITQTANATTGYQWTVKFDHNLLDLKSQTYLVANSKLIGAPGKTVWVFTAKPLAFKQPNTQTQIVLNYARPWDKKDHPINMVITVQFS